MGVGVLLMVVPPCVLELFLGRNNPDIQVSMWNAVRPEQKASRADASGFSGDTVWLETVTIAPVCAARLAMTPVTAPQTSLSK